MKKVKLILAILVCSLISLNTFSQEKKIKDRRTSPDLYFLEESDVANSLKLLPTPPDSNSVLFKYDEARYAWGKTLRNTPRGDQAFRDARVSGNGVPMVFAEAFGYEITKEKTPEIHKLIINMREDAGDLATRAAKDYYMRERPFSYYKEATCNPEQQKELSTNGSYPSGHTSIGWATALVLAEINPSRQNEILKRGFEMGESRVICGYHFQSDVDAARLVASAVVARLHANAAFMNQLNKAKEEFKKLSAGNYVPAQPVKEKEEPAKKAASAETLKIAPIGTLLVDAGVFKSDNKAFVNGASLPDIRVGAKVSYGKINAKIDVGVAYAKVSLKDIYIEKVFNPSSLVRVGYFVHQFGLQSATSSVQKITMEEPQSNAAFFNDRLIGAMYIHNKNAFYAAASVHLENEAVKRSSTEMGEVGYGAMTRLVYRPMRNDGAIFHVGISGAYETPRFNTTAALNHKSFVISAKYPSRIADVKAVEATIGNAKNLVKFTPELLIARGKVGLETQYFYVSVNRDASFSNYKASGAYGIFRGVLIGKDYKYSDADAGIETPAPGTLEFTLGYNYTDMSDVKSNIRGGRLNDVAVCFNYYINKYMIWRIRYTNTHVSNRAGVANETLNALQTRLQIRF